MRTNKTKAEFLAENRINVQARKDLLKLYDTIFLPVLDQFNGKVYNARFIKAVSAKLPEGFYIKEENRNPYAHTVELKIYCKMSQYNYNERASHIFNIVLVDDRIDANLSKVEKYTVAWRESMVKNTAEYIDAAKNYDKYLKMAEKLEALTKEFNSIPYPFRRNLNQYDFTVYI